MGNTGLTWYSLRSTFLLDFIIEELLCCPSKVHNYLTRTKTLSKWVLRSHFRSKLFGLSQIYFGPIEAKSQRSFVPWNGRISKWDSWFWITVLPTLYYLCAGDVGTGGRPQGRLYPPPSQCVQMEFMRTFQTTTKCNNMNHVWSHFYKFC